MNASSVWAALAFTLIFAAAIAVMVYVPQLDVSSTFPDDYIFPHIFVSHISN